MPRIKQGCQFHGVYRDKARDTYQALIRIDHILRFIGRFEDAEDAARAYDRVAVECIGEHAVLNFPDEHLQPGVCRGT